MCHQLRIKSCSLVGVKHFTQVMKIAVLAFFMILSGCVSQQFDEHGNSANAEQDKSDEELAMTRVSLGLGYLKIGNTTQAKSNLEKAKRFAPNLVHVHTAFAHYFDTVGEPELAIESYEEALSIKRDDPDTLNNYGVFLCRQNKLAAAEKQFLKAIDVPSYVLVSESYENLALCHLRADNFKEAEDYLAKAIRHSPSRASALQQMARLQYAKKDYKSAEHYIKRYEKSTRRISPTALALAYKIFEKKRQIRIAKDYGTMLAKMFPNSYEGRQYLLNGLVSIEADQLAEKYRAKHSQSKKKKVVLLKPRADGKPLISSNKKKTQPVIQQEKAIVQKPVQKTAEKVVEKVTAATTATTTKTKTMTQPIKSEVVEANIEEKATKQADTEVRYIKRRGRKVAVPVKTPEPVKEEVVAVEETLAVESQPEEIVPEVKKAKSAIERFLEKSSANATKAIEAKKDAELTHFDEVTQGKKPVTHTVLADETLSFISREYNIKLQSLRRWNKLADDEIIKQGDIIFLIDPNKVIPR